MGGNKYREERRVTECWWRENCEHRITDKDRSILQFINKHKLLTNVEIKNMFYRDATMRSCNRRLNTLYEDLYCIDRFFPPKKPGEGSSRQHIVLDRGAKYVLDLDSFSRTRELPIHYRHYKAVAEFNVVAHTLGLGMGKLEVDVDGFKTDIYYPSYQLSVEIDTGNEVYKTLNNHARKINRTTNINYLLFVTKGSVERKNYFIDKIDNSIKAAGSKFEDVKELINFVKDKLGQYQNSNIYYTK